jgi:hypothetical protein
LGILGVLADSLNHLVFTMPFLPSEGEATKLLINQEMKDVLVFHYLPILWYRYPVPNDIREFWYNERPDILKYLQKSYQDFDIQFLPNRIVKELNEQILTTNFSSTYDSFLTKSNDFNNSITTEILSNHSSVETNTILTNLTSLNENFHNFVWLYVERLI